MTNAKQYRHVTFVKVIRNQSKLRTKYFQKMKENSMN